MAGSSMRHIIWKVRAPSTACLVPHAKNILEANDAALLAAALVRYCSRSRDDRMRRPRASLGKRVQSPAPRIALHDSYGESRLRRARGRLVGQQIHSRCVGFAGVLSVQLSWNWTVAAKGAGTSQQEVRSRTGLVPPIGEGYYDPASLIPRIPPPIRWFPHRPFRKQSWA